MRHPWPAWTRRWEALAAALESMPEPHLTGGTWGAREVLCHLVYWHEYYVSIVHALATGDEPALKVGAFPEFNRQSVHELGTVPVPDLVTRLRRAQRRPGGRTHAAQPHRPDKDQGGFEAARAGRLRDAHRGPLSRPPGGNRTAPATWVDRLSDPVDPLRPALVDTTRLVDQDCTGPCDHERGNDEIPGPADQVEARDGAENAALQV